MLSLVFLWLGNVSFGYSAGCSSEYQAMSTANTSLSQCMNNCVDGNQTPEICSQTCSSQSTSSINATDNYNQCRAANPSDTNPTTCSDVDNAWINQNADGSCPNWYVPDGQWTLLCCNPQPEWSTTVLCNVARSNYLNEPNSKVVMPDVSCDCAPGYGELPGAPKGKKCQPCNTPGVCCGIKLNTKIPFIGDCIESSSQASGAVITETTAFPVLVTALVKILISVILIASFVLIVVAGVMRATGNAKWGKDMIVKVAIWLAILWASGVILRLINPNFFG